MLKGRRPFKILASREGAWHLNNIPRVLRGEPILPHPDYLPCCKHWTEDREFRRFPCTFKVVVRVTYKGNRGEDMVEYLCKTHFNATKKRILGIKKRVGYDAQLQAIDVLTGAKVVIY